MNNENNSSTTGSTAQILQIRQNNGQINVQNSITDVHQQQHQPKRSIQARFIDGEFSQSSKFHREKCFINDSHFNLKALESKFDNYFLYFSGANGFKDQ